MIKKLANKIGNKLLDFIFTSKKVKKILVKEEVLEDMMNFARANHPNEFMAFLGGKIEQSTLLITHLIFQSYYASKSSVVTRINLPTTSHAVGTVHSHPGPSNHPSEEDLLFFGKTGFVHFIIKYPYNYEDIAAYDFNGDPVEYEIY